MTPRRLLGVGALIGAPLATYVGYPTLVWAVAVLRPRTFVKDAMHRPPVTFVIAAHNEAALIGAKVRSILNLDYPADRLDCIVACDGCTDDTPAVARAAGDARLHVLELPRHRGKLAAIRAALPHVRGEVIAFTDANAILEQDALSHLVVPFADSDVVVVSGAKQVSNGPEAIYWRYERWLRVRESASGSVAGADGALYAVRATAVDASARPGAADDLLISLRAAQAGGRIVFAPNARTTETASPGAARAFAARTRTVSGALFALASLPHLLRPRRNDLWWKLTGHKLLRIAAPLLMAVGTIVLIDPLPRVRTTAWTAVAGLVPALALLLVPGGDFARSARRLARYALAANLAALAGLARFLARRPIDAWTPERQAPAKTHLN
ncbi:MAG: glycosyltransferase [Chloroflexi bacterium]|nr:glycosyltransferase [Chloroflexota bacterium]